MKTLIMDVDTENDAYKLSEALYQEYNIPCFVVSMEDIFYRVFCERELDKSLDDRMTDFSRGFLFARQINE
jgi:hypothetical protein